MDRQSSATLLVGDCSSNDLLADACRPEGGGGPAAPVLGVRASAAQQDAVGAAVNIPRPGGPRQHFHRLGRVVPRQRLPRPAQARTRSPLQFPPGVSNLHQRTVVLNSRQQQLEE